MVRLGRDEMIGAPHLSVDERIAKVEAVTHDDIVDTAATLLTGPKVLGVVGPFDGPELEQYL